MTQPYLPRLHRGFMTKEKRVGTMNELRVIAGLMEYGEVSVPYGDCSRYDCILDMDNQLIRIQIKTARRKNDNSFMIPCYSNTRVGGGRCIHKAYTREEADYIASEYMGRLYLIPTGEFSSQVTLSFSYPENGDNGQVKLEKDYRIENVLIAG